MSDDRRGSDMVEDLRYIMYAMTRKTLSAERIAASGRFPRAEAFERRYLDEQGRTCECGATIASDELTCGSCREDANAEADSERARLFPSRRES